MSNYFAKYLPVEGEIKKGDHFLYDKVVYLATNDGSDNVTVESEEWYHNRRQSKKVKLFLCSKDIQIGDITTRFPDILKTPDGNITITEENFNDLKYCALFKVIGEISPDAIWVKEGDNFVEEQIELRRRHPYIFHKTGQCMGGEVEGYNEWLPEYNEVRIKCSQCNTFH
jgi:response regulator RpfG family c-di-GMP phosphodiesterase